MVGNVKWFSAERGYGFIKQLNGADIFVHYSAIDAKGFRCLESGQAVQYEVISLNNRQEATHVVKL
jgi:CspA family cold shock protein